MTPSYPAIESSVRRLLAELPSHVTVVAAAKTRTPAEVAAAVRAGITNVGHNYVQEAAPMIGGFGGDVRWHLIGHLQRNKAKKAAEMFDVIETVDSLRLASALDGHCASLGKVLPVLVEVNSGREPQKTGVPPEDLAELMQSLSTLAHLRVQGLMTMGPFEGDPEDARPYFRTTKEAFERIGAAAIPGIEMSVLSMGMSHSYRVAVDEGATVVRIGTALFGPRPSDG